MLLFMSPNSPFARKVMVLIQEAGLSADVQLQAVTGSPIVPGSLPVDHNPLGKIPSLLLGDGRSIYDSRVICRYLDDRAGGGFYPKAPALWDVLTLEATADGIADAAVLMAYELRLRPENSRFPEWIEAQWAKITRALDMIETQAMDRLTGPLDMAQIALGCALGYLDLRHDVRNWRAGRPRLAAWQAEFAKRPSMQATNPPPA